MPTVMGPEPDPDCPSPGAHIWGWMSPAELDWLAATAATMDSVVEVGCLHGRSAFALLTGCPGPVYCIDPWNDPAGHCLPSFLGYCGHFPNLVAVQGYSPDADVMAQIPDQVDMVFIDGAHDYRSVIADIDAWLPRTRRLICGHDYNASPEPGFPDVRRAVDERFGAQVRPTDDDPGWELRSIWCVDVT